MTKRERIYWTHIKWCKRFNKLGVGYSAKSYPDKNANKKYRTKVLTNNAKDDYPLLDGFMIPIGPVLNPDGTPKQFDATKIFPVWHDEPKMWKE